jgi:hypothetical protein
MPALSEPHRVANTSAEWDIRLRLDCAGDGTGTVVGTEAGENAVTFQQVRAVTQMADCD